MFSRSMMALACGLALAFGAAGLVRATPYLPGADEQVLERLPFKPNDPVARDMVRLRAELLRDPRQVDVAVRLARRYYDTVAQEGDPRYLGYAQAALAPWWDMPTPPIEVQLLRASLGQFRHDFGGALADLTRVLERDPGHGQARILRAIIHVVQANYTLARADCAALKGVASELIALGCSALIDGVTGKAAPAYDTLLAAFTRTPNLVAHESLWVLLRLTELAQRLGRAEAAEMHFKQALALGIVDTFLYSAYADFLLDQKRPSEVVALLKDKMRSDSLLLRLAFAERALGLPGASAREALLAARYEAARMRGDTVHQQEEARFELTARHAPARALVLARANWAVQLEPRDARIVLESALALKDPGAAEPVLRWMAQSGIEDRTLLSLARQLKGGRP